MQDSVVRDNPYAAPASALATVAGDAPELELAGRGQRLAAQLLDTLFVLVLMVPVFAGVLMTVADPDSATFIWVGWAVTLLLSIGLIVWNCMLLSRNGQTVAKMLLGIKVVRRDGSPAGLSRIFLQRYLPVLLLSLVPGIGTIFTLVDALMIFGDERRCLHDHFADTIVVTA